MAAGWWEAFTGVLRTTTVLTVRFKVWRSYESRLFASRVSRSSSNTRRQSMVI